MLRMAYAKNRSRAMPLLMRSLAGLLAVIWGSLASALFAAGSAVKVMAGEVAIYFKTGAGATGIGASSSLALLGAGREGKPPAFCAGGDIRMIAESGAGDGSAARDFFRVEYRMNHALFTATTPVPVNWLPLSVSNLTIFIGAARSSRFKKSTLLRSLWSA